LELMIIRRTSTNPINNLEITITVRAPVNRVQER
jgi:hypothetical protein